MVRVRRVSRLIVKKKPLSLLVNISASLCLRVCVCVCHRNVTSHSPLHLQPQLCRLFHLLRACSLPHPGVCPQLFVCALWQRESGSIFVLPLKNRRGTGDTSNVCVCVCITNGSVRHSGLVSV